MREKVLAHDDAVSCLQIRGDIVVSGSWDSAIKSWKLHNSALAPLHRFDNVTNHSEVKCIDLSADGNICVFGTANGSAVLCDHRTPGLQHSLQFHQDAVQCITLSPDGRHFFTGGRDGVVKCIDSSTFAALSSFEVKDRILYVLACLLMTAIGWD